MISSIERVETQAMAIIGHVCQKEQEHYNRASGNISPYSHLLLNWGVQYDFELALTHTKLTTIQVLGVGTIWQFETCLYFQTFRVLYGKQLLF